MYKPWACGKCGAPMSGPNDHDTTAGCNVAWPSTITTGDTSGYVTSGPTIWGSEDARRLSRYDEAVRLLDEAQWELDGEHSPETVKRIEAFLASESREEEGGR